MCFRPASTTMGARICKSCYNVVDDVEASECPHCGEPLEASFVNEGSATAPNAAAPPAPGAQTPPAPKTPSAPSAPTPPASGGEG